MCERLGAVLAVVTVRVRVLLVDSRMVSVGQNMALMVVHWLRRRWWWNRGKGHGRPFAFSGCHPGARVVDHAIDVGGTKTIEIAVELALIPAR